MSRSTCRHPVSGGAASQDPPPVDLGEPSAPRPRQTLMYTPSAFVVLAGVWLVMAPFALGYHEEGGGFGGPRNDIVVGGAVIMLALVRIIAPVGTAALSLVNVLLGIWLIAAPFALGYNAVPAMANHLIVGPIVVMLAAVGWFAAPPGKQGSGQPRRAGRSA